MQLHGRILASLSDTEVCAASMRGMLSLLSTEPRMALGNLECPQTLRAGGSRGNALPGRLDLHCLTTTAQQASVRCTIASRLQVLSSSQHKHILVHVETCSRPCGQSPPWRGGANAYHPLLFNNQDELDTLITINNPSCI